MIIRIWAFLTNGKLVLLTDIDGTVSLSIARIDHFGNMIAERHWPYKIRTVTLLPDGTVDGCYVKLWKYA